MSIFFVGKIERVEERIRKAGEAASGLKSCAYFSKEKTQGAESYGAYRKIHQSQMKGKFLQYSLFSSGNRVTRLEERHRCG